MYRRTHAALARDPLQKRFLTEKTAAHVREVFVDGQKPPEDPRWILVRYPDKEQIVGGRVQRFQLGPSQTDDIYVFIDERPPKLLDTKSPHEVVVLDDVEGPKLAKKAGPPKKSAAASYERFRELVCAQRASLRSNPKLAEIENAVATSMQKESNIASLRMLSCTSAMIPGVGMFAIDGLNTYAGHHATNFYEGILLMGGFQCLLLGAMNPKTALYTTVTANLAGNVWEEIEIPGLEGKQRSLPGFSSHGREVKTDLPDFASGALASAAFFAAFYGLQRMLPTGATLQCE